MKKNSMMCKSPFQLFSFFSPLAALSLLLLLTACNEEETPSVDAFPFKEKKTWRLTAVVSDVSRTVNGIASRNWREQMGDCKEDDLFYTSDYHTLDTDQGQWQCDRTDLQVKANAIHFEYKGNNTFLVVMAPSAKRMIYDYVDDVSQELWTLKSRRSNELIFTVDKEYEKQLYQVTLTFAAL